MATPRLIQVLLFSVLLLSHSLFAANERLTITGSSTVAPLALEIAKRFEKKYPGTRIDVQAGGSSRGIADTRSGRADLGMVSRALKPLEADLISHPIAKDGIGIIVHASNAVSELSEQEIVDIFTGKISNWQTISGNNGRITVVNKAEGRSTLELFLAQFHLRNSEIKASVIIGDNQQGIKTISGNPHAIGYVSIGSAEYEASIGTEIKLLPLSKVDASVENVREGKFPLSRPLNFVSTTKPSTLAKHFVEFAQSKAVNDLIEAQYFVPLAD